MLTLMIGGAGSGKSAFAEELVCRLDGRRVYLATMEIADAESRARVARHRALRQGRGFETVECSRNLPGAAIRPGANVLLEDLSNLLANEMFSPQGGGIVGLRRGLSDLIARCRHLTVVTNEVFSDGVRYDEDSEKYLRALAALNRELAAEAALAVEVVCGLPNVLKGELPW